MKNSVLFFLLILMISLAASCKKTPPPDPAVVFNQIDFSISYKIDAGVFETNAMKYVNAAGNRYSINRLQYYVSEINLIKENGSKVLVKDYHYIDATVAATALMRFTNIPAGNYKGVSFNLGLDSLHNISDILPANTENINMIWPAMMGGGYHFMKMEGHFIDSAGGTFGYAMHLGTNATLIPITVLKNFTVTADSKFPLTAIMNINEWYRNPEIFDFNKDGNYIMGNAIAMKKFAKNGLDVFSF